MKMMIAIVLMKGDGGDADGKATISVLQIVFLEVRSRGRARGIQPHYLCSLILLHSALLYSTLRYSPLRSCLTLGPPLSPRRCGGMTPS